MSTTTSPGDRECPDVWTEVTSPTGEWGLAEECGPKQRSTAWLQSTAIVEVVDRQDPDPDAVAANPPEVPHDG